MQKLSIPFVLLLSLTFFSSRCQKTISKKADSVKILDPEKIVFGDTTAGEFYELGEHYFEKKQYKKSLNAFNSTIKLNPEYVIAYVDIGIIYNELGYYQKAISNLEIAIKKILKW